MWLSESENLGWRREEGGEGRRREEEREGEERRNSSVATCMLYHQKPSHTRSLGGSLVDGRAPRAWLLLTK